MIVRLKGPSKQSTSSSDGSGLRSFHETYEGNMPVKTGLIIYAEEECRWYDKNTIVLPWNTGANKS